MYSKATNHTKELEETCMHQQTLPIRLISLILALLCALPAMAETAENRRITLSGNPEDIITMENNCYTEGDRVLVFFQKGTAIPGDTLSIVQGVMTELEQQTGLSFDDRWQISHTDNYTMMFEEDVFNNLNAKGETVEVMIASLGDWSPYATENTAVIDVMDLEGPERMALYHELAHVLYMRNAVDMGLCLDEGLATWTLDQLYRQKGIPCWTTEFYMNYSDFDETLITGGESGFSINFESSDDNYCYGYRLITFLTETYGVEIIPRLLKAATEDGFNPSYEVDAAAETKADTEHMKGIIKSVTGEDVFDRFAAWHQNEMPRVRQEYQAYMASLTQE